MDVLTRRFDEGHIPSDEDYIFDVKWTVSDLINQGYSEEIILLWEDNESWSYYAKIFLDALNQ
ncbi:MAG: hypothetical protein JZU53_14570 [Paludibacter sp.]|nr:hypothetical protein [Paludibacter sp.]